MRGGMAASYFAARRVREIHAVAASWREQGLQAVAGRWDVTRPADVRALARGAQRAAGEVDMLVNNAGIAR